MVAKKGKSRRRPHLMSIFSFWEWAPSSAAPIGSRITFFPVASCMIHSWSTHHGYNLNYCHLHHLSHPGVKKIHFPGRINNIMSLSVMDKCSTVVLNGDQVGFDRFLGGVSDEVWSNFAIRLMVLMITCNVRVTGMLPPSLVRSGSTP